MSMSSATVIFYFNASSVYLLFGSYGISNIYLMSMHHYSICLLYVNGISNIYLMSMHHYSMCLLYVYGIGNIYLISMQHQSIFSFHVYDMSNLFLNVYGFLSFLQVLAFLKICFKKYFLVKNFLFFSF